MSTYEDILADIQVAQRDYHEFANTKPAPELRTLSDRIKGLRQELSDAASEGAKACPSCKRRPHGMRRTEATRRTPELWEIGCLGCPPRDGVRFCARGATRKQAVEKWNAGEFVKV